MDLKELIQTTLCFGEFEFFDEVRKTGIIIQIVASREELSVINALLINQVLDVATKSYFGREAVILHEMIDNLVRLEERRLLNVFYLASPLQIKAR
jgi:hypothetical protein